MDKKELNIAIVGLGFGAEFIPIYQRYEGVNLYAICQRTEEELNRIGDQFGIDKRYTSYEDLLNDSEIDAVHINTPIPMHGAQSIQALKAGKHVACTVPMATTVDECKEIVRVAMKTNGTNVLRLMWHPALLTLAIMMVFAFHARGQNGGLKNQKSLFDGVSLDGWEVVNPVFRGMWYVKDSTIHCGNGKYKIPGNTYLYTTEEYENFELRLLFRITGDATTGMINSGIQYRSFIEDGRMIGYQADIGDGYWGDIYDEHRRGKLVGGDLSVLSRILNKNGWNSYIIRCQGDLHEIYINGVKTAEYIEKDPSVPSKGVISVQNHSGGNSHVEFRDIVIEVFP